MRCNPAKIRLASTELPLSVPVIQVSPIALLAGMSPRESREILSIANSSSYASEENLFLEGQPANCLILVETGRVKLSRIGRDGDEVILRICGPGEILDLYDESGNGRHQCSARSDGSVQSSYVGFQPGLCIGSLSADSD